MIYRLVILGILSFAACSRKSELEPLQMHLQKMSWYSDNPNWGPITNAGSLVVDITVGRASGELLHVAHGEARKLGTFEFDASLHTKLCSTPTIDSKGTIDAGFIMIADQSYTGERGLPFKPGKVTRFARASEGISVLEGANVLYRITRTEEHQDRWRLAQEASLEALINTSASLDCEYIILNIHQKR